MISVLVKKPWQDYNVRANDFNKGSQTLRRGAKWRWNSTVGKPYTAYHSCRKVMTRAAQLLKPRLNEASLVVRGADGDAGQFPATVPIEHGNN
jgi:hypothetical protein